MKNALLIWILAIQFQFISAQEITRLGDWSSYLNYTEGIRSEEVGGRIYCATEHGLFYIDKEDISVSPLSKINGFTDVEIATFRYDKVGGDILIAYRSSNMDLIRNGEIINIPDIYRSAIIGRKAINDIYFSNGKAYISCSFGIVVYDLVKMEVKETYSEIGTGGNQVEVYAVTINNGYIYAATSSNVIRADITEPNLQDYRTWTEVKSSSGTAMVSFGSKVYLAGGNKISSYDGSTWSNYIDTVTSAFNSMDVYHNKLVIAFKTVLYLADQGGQVDVKNKNNESHVLLDNEGVLWYTIKKYGMIRVEGSSSPLFIAPNGPFIYKCWDAVHASGKLYVVPGATTDGWGKTFTTGGMYVYEYKQWTNMISDNMPVFLSLPDLISVAVSPVDNHVYAGSFGSGIVEFDGANLVKKYNQSNSSLGNNSGSSDTANIQVSSMAFDKNGNMWVANWASARPVCVRFKNGTWASWDIGSSGNRNLGKVVIDDDGQKWFNMPVDGGLIVFDERKPAGQNYRKLTNAEGNGNLPASIVRSMALDLDGRIWVGTDEGVAVFYDPSAVFSNNNFDAQRVWVDEGSNSGYLLATEVVTAIAVDGGNNKWLGTRKGVWQVSPDGTRILNHFTTDNSPLPSNLIRDISIDGESGEVFFLTNGGIVSYRGKAIQGGEGFGNVYAYPNPVKPGYTGLIAIRGLVRDASVKITDIAGNLVYETTSEGGQAVWDGKNFDGTIVKSGVYLVFSTNEDGSATNVTKILIVR